MKKLNDKEKQLYLLSRMPNTSGIANHLLMSMLFDKNLKKK